MFKIVFLSGRGEGNFKVSSVTFILVSLLKVLEKWGDGHKIKML